MVACRTLRDRCGVVIGLYVTAHLFLIDADPPISLSVRGLPCGVPNRSRQQRSLHRADRIQLDDARKGH
jgi:hypothetical protein